MKTIKNVEPIINNTMLKQLIEDDAGWIEQVLSEKKKLTINELEQVTGYRTQYIYIVLGWLAHKNEIFFIEQDDNLCIEINGLS